ncbi:MAG: flagellar hook-basal body complex protein, partial [Armatimonadota bacterium]
MTKGMYCSAAGMLSQLEYHNVLAANLANANTAGFKRTAVGFMSVLADAERTVRITPLPGNAEPDVPVPKLVIRVDNGQGPIEDTGNQTHLAIIGPGSFCVQSTGGIRQVRNGSFTLDASGTLTTDAGEPVLGRNGPITLKGTTWTIEPDGTVVVDGTAVDKIRLEAPAGETPGQVVQGSLEGSNVNPVLEMVAMITAL